MKPAKQIDLNEILVLRQSLTVAEIAKHFGVSKSTIEKRLNPKLQVWRTQIMIPDEIKLTQKDKIMLPLLRNILEQFATEKQPINSNVLCDMLRTELRQQSIKHYQVSPSEIRKWCNYIRSCSILPLVANSKGYFITSNNVLLIHQIESLTKRVHLIKMAATGLKAFIKKSRS